ncbi:unnamed protein product, partial [Sphacelaria rigidula]
HAVPEIALRDLRRAFHKNTAQQQQADDKSWKVASPPRGAADKRTSPEPEPTRSSPSPLRLGLQPGLLGSPPPSPTSDVVDPSYAWMGRDGTEFDCGRISGRTTGECMAYEGDSFRAEGVLCHSPATRFGARDGGNCEGGGSRYFSSLPSPQFSTASAPRLVDRGRNLDADLSPPRAS